MKTKRIIGAVATPSGATVFLANGKPVELSKNNWQTKEILSIVTEDVSKKGYSDIDLDSFTAHGAVEKKTEGRLRFFGKKIASFFGLGETDDPVLEKTKSDDGIVAEIDGKRVEGVEALNAHIEHAAETGEVEGLENFLSRMAVMSEKRKHTVDELLNFMKRADLPIANDGSIIAYKILQSVEGEEDVYVDCHSKRVRQKLGSRVEMPESAVDDSRRTQCSTGLHIARRGYLSGFRGNIMTLVKIAPEDVIAVPFNEPDKMRVCAYHIIDIIPSRLHATLRSNRSMTSDTEAQTMLGKAIAGDHVDVLEVVQVGMTGDREVKTTQADTPQTPPKPKRPSKPAISVDQIAKKGTSEINLDELREKKRAAAMGAFAAAVSSEVEKMPEEAPEPAPKASDAKKTETRSKPASKAPVKSKKAPVKPKPKAEAKPKPKEAKAARPKNTSSKPVSAAKAKSFNELPDNYKEALKRLSEGQSQRQIATDLSVCPKTMRKLIKAGLKYEA